MRSVKSPDESDLTAKARIRDAAIELIGANGADAASVRDIAAAAGVSAPLVMHHFGSKAGLREAIVEYVVNWAAELAADGSEQLAAAIAAGDVDAMADLGDRWQRLVHESATARYVRRMFIDNPDAAVEVLRAWHQSARDTLLAWGEMGIAHVGAEPALRAAVILANDLTLLLLGPAFSGVLGIDLSTSDGASRWMAAQAELYRGELYASPQTSTCDHETSS